MRHARRLLVTGASGFLGAQIVARAASGGFEVIAQVHRAPMPAWQKHPVETTILELASDEELERALEAIQPAIVIHAAARSRVADCERDPDLARRVNVDATTAIARWCAAHAARLVHASTDLVFGAVAAPSGGFRESDSPAPLSTYGRTKLAAEHAVLEGDPRALVVRLPLLVGPSQARGLGASDSVLAAVDRGLLPALFEDEWRTPLDVRSAAEALIELASGELAGILHVAGPERISRYEIGLRALRQRGLRADQAREKLLRTTRASAGFAAERPADVSLNCALARTSLQTLLVGLESGSI
ncbi:MAG TPA: SDR family oxidoreductase [Planctomycetota bacterium]|nr:SDR family oxidoreductase [Planctomycetota bacterium]